MGILGQGARGPQTFQREHHAALRPAKEPAGRRRHLENQLLGFQFESANKPFERTRRTAPLKSGVSATKEDMLSTSDMQPAHYKPRLSNRLSYPIGFEALEHALGQVPMFGEIELSFYAHSGRTATESRRTIEAKRTHLIVRAGFARWDKRLSSRDEWLQRLFRGIWSLHVYPVAREFRAVAKNCLLVDGLPQLSRWFSAERPSSWYWGRKSCDVYFLPDVGRVRVTTTEKAQ